MAKKVPARKTAKVETESPKPAGGMSLNVATATSEPSESATGSRAGTSTSEVATAPTDNKPARQSNAPWCPYCKTVRCESQGSSFYYTRYKCKTPGCTYRENVPRPRMNDRIAAAKAHEHAGFSARPKS